MSTRGDFRQLLDHVGGVLFLDGGLATELERRGADVSSPLWSAAVLLKNPELIRQVHEDYFRAGADIGISASYQASFDGFARCGVDAEQAAALMRRSVQLVREAGVCVGDDSAASRRYWRPLTAASIGCYGASRHDGSEYRGDYGLSVQQLMDWHRPRLEVLATSGADLLACETIPCLDEAEALARLLEEFPHLPAWLSFSCRDERRLCSGAPFTEAVAAAHAAPSVVAVGVNCTPPQYVEALLHSVQGQATLSLVAYPNSGECWNAATRLWEKEKDRLNWLHAARRWYAAGARLIGGCCRTTPATIRKIVKALQDFRA